MQLFPRDGVCVQSVCVCVWGGGGGGAGGGGGGGVPVFRFRSCQGFRFKLGYSTVGRE